MLSFPLGWHQRPAELSRKLSGVRGSYDAGHRRWQTESLPKLSDTAYRISRCSCSCPQPWFLRLSPQQGWGPRSGTCGTISHGGAGILVTGWPNRTLGEPRIPGRPPAARFGDRPGSRSKECYRGETINLPSLLRKDAQVGAEFRVPDRPTPEPRTGLRTFENCLAARPETTAPFAGSQAYLSPRSVIPFL